MKTLIIKTIAKNFRKKLPIARNLQVKHLAYMYDYNYWNLLQSLKDALSLNPQHFNDRFIK